MLKKILLTMLFSVIAVTASFAYEIVVVDGIRYYTYSSNKTAVVSDFVSGTANAEYYVGDIIIPETISVDGVDYTVTEIGSEAFEFCKKMTSIKLPETIEKIGVYSFRNCTNITTIGDLPNVTTISDYAFAGCTSLESIGDMPNVYNIGYSAFNGCLRLCSIGVMPMLKFIDYNAFSNTALADLYLPKTVKEVKSGAFSDQTIVHFEGLNPPTFLSTSFGSTFVVAPEVVEAYKQALPDMPPHRILPEGLNTKFEVTVSAQDNGSDVLDKVNLGSDKDLSYQVLDLTVKGTINSYDVMVMRNKMLNLRTLDLSEATIVANPYEYMTGVHTSDNVISSQMFQDLKLTKVILPDNITAIQYGAFLGCRYLSEVNIPECVTKIGQHAFNGCSSLQKIGLPQSLATIDYNAFQSCSSIREIIIPESIECIPSYCFSGCSSLNKVVLPPTLKKIQGGAFSNCSSLTEIRIPAGVSYIGDGAIPSTVKDVYTYTIQPTNINQNTFGSSTYLTATLHVPETSESLYYWDTQWSQFQSITNFNEPYSYFYLSDKDLIENPDTPRIDGETDDETGDKKNPDADLGAGSGLVVEGDNSQDLGNVDLEHDGNGNGATIIGGDSNQTESGGNINIDMLNIKINVEANKWYFFSFPFDIKCENIKFNGQMVWRYYDGEWRAMYGSGAWKNLKEDYLRRGIGYIFQASKKGTLELSIPNASFDAQDWKLELERNVSDMAQDASWNLVGNPFQSYYELADLGFDGPITWWNPNTKSYEAYSPLDDDMTLYPFMAFFVQKPEGVNDIIFENEYQETNNQKNDNAKKSAARRRRAARRVNAGADDRMLVNLEVTDGTNGDRTRVVFNSNASSAYENGVDAAKFMSVEAPQIYSIDAENVLYSINERPLGDGTVRLGFYAPVNAVYTITCTRTDCPVMLKDLKTNNTVELAEGQEYKFTANAGYDDDRFMIVRANDNPTAVEEIAAPGENAVYYQTNGLKSNDRQGVMIQVKGKDVKKVIK